MKKSLAVGLFFVGFAAFAGTVGGSGNGQVGSFSSTKYLGASNNAQLISKILSSDKTPEDAKKLLEPIVTGQGSSDTRVTVLSVESDAALGTYYTTIEILADDLVGELKSNYEITVIELNNKITGKREISEVKFQLTAG